MPNITFSARIMTFISAQMKSNGITQKDAAKALRVSVPTVKRWLSGRGVSLEVFNALAEMLDLDLDQISILFKQNETTQFTYTLEQETFLAKHPSALAVFDILLRQGHIKMSHLEKFTKVSSVSLRKYLRQLEQLKLIERGTNDRLKVLPKGDPAWIPNGPLQKQFRKTFVQNFSSDAIEPKATLGIFDLSPEDVVEIRSQLNNLLNHVKRRSRMSKMGDSKGQRTYGVMFKIAEFEWEILRSVEEI